MARRLQRHSWDDNPIRHCKAEWLKSLGIEIDRILQAKLSRYAASQLGDLVLRRRFQVDKSPGMKLHATWDGPYKLTRISKSEVSSDLEDLKIGKVISRYAFRYMSPGARVSGGWLG